MIGFACNTAIGCYLEYVTIMSTPTLQTKLIESVQNTIPSRSFVIRCILDVHGLELNTSNETLIRNDWILFLNLEQTQQVDPWHGCLLLSMETTRIIRNITFLIRGAIFHEIWSHLSISFSLRFFSLYFVNTYDIIEKNKLPCPHIFLDL